MTEQLCVGDRVCLSGGYEMEPEWLRGVASRLGTVTRFIPGQNQEPAAVVLTDQLISCDGATGRVLVLELRHVGARWYEHGTVHLELCDFEPESKAWKDRRQGKWIESHAEYRRLHGAE